MPNLVLNDRRSTVSLEKHWSLRALKKRKPFVIGGSIYGIE